MYTATVQLKIDSFVPYSAGGKVAYQFTSLIPDSISGGVFSLSGTTITVKCPQGYTGSFQIIYQLQDPAHVLLGIAVKSTTAEKTTKVTSGRLQFPNVVVQRDTGSSLMTVTDVTISGTATFDYDILVQATSMAKTPANQGKIGIIDPDIDNEGGGE